MNWQKDKLTIIGFGIIFVILGVFGYFLWDMNREPMAEVVTEESTPPETIVPETPASEEQELPEYPITKLDTTGWEYRETKLGDVGIRYKVMNQNLDNRVGDDKFLDPHFDLKEFEINGLMWGADNKVRFGKGYDMIQVFKCINCGGGPYEPAPGRINIDIVETSNLNLRDIENILLNQTCSYSIVKTDDMNPYTLNEKCTTGEQLVAYNSSSQIRESKKIGDIINLRVSEKEISQYKNPFISTDKASQLITYTIAIGAQDFSENNIDDPEIFFDNQLVFIVDLGNDKFAIITQSDFPENEEMKATRIMHTILSTIEVL
jgi:hypothetical protein